MGKGIKNNKVIRTWNKWSIPTKIGVIGSIASIIGVALLFMPTDSGTNQPVNSVGNIEISGNQNSVTVNQINGISEQLFKEIIQPYEEQVAHLKTQLESTKELPERLALSKQITELEETIAIKQKEISQLQERLKSLNQFSEFDWSNRVGEILSNQGLDKAIKFLDSIDTQQEEEQLEKYKKSLSEKYLARAEMYKLKGIKDEVIVSYDKAIRYNRLTSTLIEYAEYLDHEREEGKALSLYEEVNSRTNDPNEKLLSLIGMSKIYKESNQFNRANMAINFLIELIGNKIKFLGMPHIMLATHHIANYKNGDYEFEVAIQLYELTIDYYKIFLQDTRFPPEVHFYHKTELARTLANLSIAYMGTYQYDLAKKNTPKR